MATTLFTNAVTLSDAGWFNDVDTAVYALTAVAGTNTITATGPTSLTAYATGKIHKFIPAATNTGATTINISSLGAKNVFYSGAACVGGELKINVPVQIYYDGTQFNILGANTIYTPSSTTSKDLVSYVHADVNTGHRDVIKAAFIPGWFNQQWGGGVNGYELVDAATGVPYKFESATGYVEQTASVCATGYDATNTGTSQGFKVSANQSIPAVWVKLYKVGNPTGTLECRIQADDGTGTKPTANYTAITNGTATALSGQVMESGDTSGQWYRFVFPTPPALTAGTQYHITLKNNSAASTSNYWQWISGAGSKYPHGNMCQGTSVPVWTASTTVDNPFLIEAPSTTATFQSGGIFGDGKAVFNEGSPLNQSNQRRADLADLKGLNMGSLTGLFRGTAQTKDKTLADFFYGSTENRVVLRCAVTTGFPTLTLYDSSGTARTVTGTTDISSGDHDVAMKLIANTGSSTDKLELWVDGASQGTAITGVALTIDTLFQLGQVGSKWVGGGFPLAPTWTGSSILTGGFSGLPSTLGWTWTGAATEANASSVSGGLHYFNKSGYTALQDGYYGKTITANNATGTVLEAVVKINSATNTAGQDYGFALAILDGTKRCSVGIQEYFASVTMGGSTYYVQYDFKSTFNCVQLQSKGSDAYLVVNGRILFDGTGLNTTANGSNTVAWGDFQTASGEHFDATTKSIKYYTGGLLMPQATAGSLSEWAIWTGDKTGILATLWNSGSPISVKQFCGLGVNWKRGDDGAWVHRVVQRGITNGPTQPAFTTPMPELSGFIIGDLVSAVGAADFEHNGAGQACASAVYVDGALSPESAITGYDSLLEAYAASYNINVALLRPPIKTYFGPHSVVATGGTNVATYTLLSTRRKIAIEARS